MLVVALVISTSTVRVRAQAEPARERERRTAALYAMSRELASTRGVDELLRGGGAAHRRGVRQPGGRPAPGRGRPARCRTRPATPAGLRAGRERAGGGAVGLRARPARRAGHRHAAGRRALYLPLTRLARHGRRPGRAARRDPRAAARAGAAPSARDLRRARRRWPSSGPGWPRRRSGRRCAPRPSGCATRCSARSRTTCARRWPPSPGAASSLLENETRLDAATRRELLETPARGGRPAEPAGQQPARHDPARSRRAAAPQGVAAAGGGGRRGADAAGSALARPAGRPPGCRPICRSVPLDGVLIEQVLVNLLDNAIKYTPRGQPDRDRGRGGRRRRVRRRGGRPRARASRRGRRSAASSRSSTAGRAAPEARRRPRARDLPGHRRGPRRADLGREPARRRRRVPLHAAAGGEAPPDPARATDG